MALLDWSTVPEPQLPSETVAVAELGGELEVRAVPLDELQALLLENARTPELAVPRLLAATVRDANGATWSPDRWRVWGGAHARAAMRLYATAQRVCGIGAGAIEAAEGKSARRSDA